MTWVVVGVILAAVVLTACFGGARSRLRRSGDLDHGERAETARRLQQQIDEGRYTGGWIS